jgi:hypothetical protein
LRIDIAKAIVEAAGPVLISVRCAIFDLRNDMNNMLKETFLSFLVVWNAPKMS